jgi:hypothetical protein
MNVNEEAGAGGRELGRRTYTLKRFLWSVSLPSVWLLLFYGFVGHVRLALGRWPHFGEGLHGRLLTIHEWVVMRMIAGLVLSLYPVGVLLVGCLIFRRWRYFGPYLLSYAAAVGLVFGSIFLAPGPFRDWFFD